MTEPVEQRGTIKVKTGTVPIVVAGLIIIFLTAVNQAAFTFFEKITSSIIFYTGGRKE